MLRPYPVICHLVSGQVETFLDRTESPHFVRNAGQTCLFPAHVRKRSRILSEDGGEIKAAVMSFEVSQGVNLLNFFDTPFIFNPDASEKLAGLVNDLIEAMADKQTPIIQKMASRKKICFEVLEVILSCSTMREKAGSNVLALKEIFPVVEYMSRNFRKPLRVSELSRRGNLSRANFFRKFKQLTGVSPLDYCKNLRLQEARSLLHATDKSVAEIGESVGWPDQFHFSRVFKASVGLSPLRYRLSLAEEIL